MKIYEKERVFVRQYSYIAAGVMVLLFGGIIYAWSTLSVPMIAEFKEWTLSQISFTFTLCTLFFCIGGFLRGLIASKYSIRFTMLAAAILGCAGMLLTAQTTNNILFLYCGFGVLSGFSIGLAYNTVMSTVTSYFDTNRGTVSGILLMGFGFGSFVMGKVYQTILSSMILDWHGIFRLFAIAILLIFVLAGFVLKENSEETHEITTLESSIPTMDMTTKEMLHTRVFWTYFLWAILLASSGYILLSHANGILTEAVSHIHADTAATLVGLISICNGVGRIFWGFVYDKFQYKLTFMAIETAFALNIVMLYLGLRAESIVCIVTGFIAGGLFFAGLAALNSVFISDFFGTKYYPLNFSIINLNVLISSFGSVIAAIVYDKTGSYLSVILLLGCEMVLSLICILQIKKPKTKNVNRNSI